MSGWELTPISFILYAEYVNALENWPFVSQWWVWARNLTTSQWPPLYARVMGVSLCLLAGSVGESVHAVNQKSDTKLLCLRTFWINMFVDKSFDPIKMTMWTLNGERCVPILIHHNYRWNVMICLIGSILKIAWPKHTVWVAPLFLN